MQIKDYIISLADRLNAADLSFAHGTDNAFDEAVYLVYCSLDIDFDISVDDLDAQLNPEDEAKLEELACKRINENTPVAYLVGKAWFAGYEFFCDSRALIPRSPIAELIANRFQPMLRQAPKRILDLCCGGGCIGIAAAHEFPQSEVVLADISPGCLALAGENIGLHGLNERVQLCQSDLFADLSGTFDLILTNPPYVGATEVASLPAEFHHEPESGLLSKEDGLDIPLRILRDAAGYLSAEGLLIMEVGFSAQALQSKLAGVPLLWLEFEEGGEGVFALSRRQLEEYREAFN